MIFDNEQRYGIFTVTSALYLNQNGYTREPARNAVNPKFNDWKAEQVKRILDNPLYTGKIASREEGFKITGKRIRLHLCLHRKNLQSERTDISKRILRKCWNGRNYEERHLKRILLAHLLSESHILRQTMRFCEKEEFIGKISGQSHIQGDIYLCMQSL